MAPASPTVEASFLEAVVLAFVRTHQPCTAYFVRSCFQRSISPRFSGSGGAIYPVIDRLEQRGFLELQEHHHGKRVGRHCSVTAAGMKVVRAWMMPPPDLRESMCDDPLRTRSLFLGLLPKRERVRWFDKTEERLIAELAAIDAYARTEDGSGSPYQDIANDNARRLNRARLEWLRQARTRLEAES